MKLLYSGLDELLRKVPEMVPKLTSFPVVSKVTTTIIYLGPASGLVEVEIKENKETKGWLYLTNAIVFFHHNDELYEVFISTLRELTVEKMADKKFVKDGEEPAANTMKRDGGKIVGYISVEDLLSISNKLSTETDYL